MRVRYVRSGGSVIRTAFLTLVESLVHPFSTTMIWESIPIETKSFNPDQEIVRARTRDAVMGKAPAHVPPLFKMVVLIVLGLTVVSGIAEVTMAMLWTNPSPMQHDAFQSMETSWKMGFGALMGLIGGKSVR